MSNQINNSSGKTEDVDKEVANLLKKSLSKQRTTFAIAEDLKHKYKDDAVIDSIIAKYREQLVNVKKIAEKIKNRLITKYPNLTTKEYLSKIADYKKKYNFNETQMTHIIHLLFNAKNKNDVLDQVDIGYNEMSKALGFVPLSYNFNNKMNVKQEELEHLQAILKEHADTRELHRNVNIQSEIYTTFDAIHLSSTSFDRTRTNTFSSIHPIIFALFFIKHAFLDRRMLIASIANIVKQRYEQNEINTIAEYELYTALSTDPSECSKEGTECKPFVDLLSRCRIQTALLENVLNLRQGKFYTNGNSFEMAIRNSKNSAYDFPDFTYVYDEGTIIRKLFGAFSLRPTIVTTAPLYGVSTPLNRMSVLSSTNITSVPIIPVRVPERRYEFQAFGEEDTQEYKLTDALAQKQIYTYKNQMSVKTQQIIYSSNMLLFYVPRRFVPLNLDKIYKPYQMAKLPATLSSNEVLYDVPINFDNTVSINRGKSQMFALRSIVMVKTIDNNMKDRKIIGTTSLVLTNEYPDYYIVYDPLVINPEGKINPVNRMPIADSHDSESSRLYQIEIKQKATIYMYVDTQEED